MAYFDDFEIINGTTVVRSSGMTVNEVPFHALKLVLHGRFRFGRHGQTIHDLTAPVLFWQRPGVVYERGPINAWTVTMVRFTGSRAAELLDRGFDAVSPHEFCVLHDPEPVRLLLERMGRLQRQPVAFEWAHGQLLAEELLLAVLRDQKIVDDRARNPYAAKLTGLAERLARKPAEPTDFHVEAAALGLSYSHFRKLFRDQTGNAPQDYLILCRLRTFANDLLYTDRAIKRLALELGYRDPAYLSRLFRNRYGMSPAAYRAANRQL